MNTATDSECERTWVEEALGDARAFERLYNLYFPRVYAYVSYRVGRVQDTEDLVADTFLKAVTGLEKFQWRHEGSFASWLFRIAHNAITDYHRQAGKRDQPLPLDHLPQIRSGALLPEDIIMQREKSAHLRHLIGTLPPRRQEVITLKFFGELRNSEIAVVLRLDERTVASHLCRGIEDLHRKYLEEQAAQEDTQ